MKPTRTRGLAYHPGRDTTTTNAALLDIDMARPQTRAGLAKECGPVVYAVRLPDGAIKIGFTTNLPRRIKALGADLTDILALMPGTREDEQRIHATLRLHRRQGWEYYEPNPPVIAAVNRMRAHFGFDAIAA